MSYDYEKVEVPDDGEKITPEDGTVDTLRVPETPIIPILYGDGIGMDIGSAAQRVLEATSRTTGRDISWMRIYADEIIATMETPS